LDIDQNDAGGWYNRGTDLGKLGRYEEALKSYDKALELDPNYANAQKNRDLAYKQLGTPTNSTG
jgi:tetratricopeptide (TPR) repeat protein